MRGWKGGVSAAYVAGKEEFPRHTWLESRSFRGIRGWKGGVSAAYVAGKEEFPRHTWLERRHNMYFKTHTYLFISSNQSSPHKHRTRA